MTVDLYAAVLCNWPGCGRHFHHGKEVVCFEVRRQAEAKGWTILSAIDGFHHIETPDFCPLHPRHDGHYLGDSWRLHCLNCSWTDEDPVEPTMDDSFARWIAHLPQLQPPPGTPVEMTFPDDDMEMIDKYAGQRRLTREDMIRQLVDSALQELQW